MSSQIFFLRNNVQGQFYHCCNVHPSRALGGVCNQVPPLIRSMLLPVNRHSPQRSTAHGLKLSYQSSIVLQLQQKFLANYPSEALTADTQPSPRLLSLPHQLAQKKEFKWLPWKFRMSMSRAEELTMGRAAKAPGWRIPNYISY